MKYKFHHYVTKIVNTDSIPGRDGMCYWVKQFVEWVDTEGKHHKTPKNIVSDGLSYPKICWGLQKWLFSLIDGFAHDPAYWLQEYPKKIADYNIWAGIRTQREYTYSWWRKRKVEFVANVTWTGLRLGGWVAWDRYTEQLERLGYKAVLEMHTADTIEEAVVIAQRGFK